MNKPILLLILIVAILPKATAQDFSFSQYHYTPFLTNPADVATDGSTQAWVNYCQRQLVSGDMIKSTIASFVTPFAKHKGGFGISMVNDRQGRGLVTNGALATANYRINFRTHFVSMGVQACLLSREVDLAGLSTSSQFIAGAFDPNASINESLINDARGYLTFGGGAIWYKPGNAYHHKAFLGGSVLNINEPNAAFVAEGGDNSIPLRTTISGGIQILRSGRVSVVPNFRVINDRKHTFSNFGTWLRYDLGQSRFPAQVISLGTWYNTNGFATTSIEWEGLGYFAALSYDIPFFEAAQVFQNSGTIEMTLGIRFKKTVVSEGKVIDWMDRANYLDSALAAQDSIEMDISPVPPTEDSLSDHQAIASQDTTAGTSADSSAQIQPEATDLADQPKPQAQDTTAITASDPTEAPPIAPDQADTNSDLTDPESTLPKELTPKEFGDIKFELGSAHVTQESMEILKRLAIKAQSNPELKVELIGHTCDIGDELSNQKLSWDRANRVKKILTKLGIPADRITAKGVGYSDPLVPNINKANRFKNRRVEMIIID